MNRETQELFLSRH